MAKAKQGQQNTKQNPQQKNKAKMNGVKKTQPFKKENGAKNINAKSIQNVVKEAPQNTKQFTDGYHVQVDIPKNMKTKSREAVQKILHQSQELNCYVKSVTLKFQDHKTLGETVMALKKINIDGKYLSLPNSGSAPPKSPQTQRQQETPEKNTFTRTFAVPVGSKIDVESVREYFGAEKCRSKRGSKTVKVYRLIYLSEEAAKEAMEKTLKLDDQEITLRDPVLYHQQMQATRQEGKSEQKKRKSSESTPVETKKGKFVVTKKEDDDEVAVPDDDDEVAVPDDDDEVAVPDDDDEVAVADDDDEVAVPDDDEDVADDDDVEETVDE